MDAVNALIKRCLSVLFCLLLASCAMERPGVIDVVDDIGAYGLASGDQVRVVVYDQPTLSAVYSVDASGSISVPLAGRLKAAGLTAAQLERVIVNRLRDKDLVSDPKVAVEIAVYRPFSILGEVKTPGRFPYAPGMTLEAAVALAGGYSLFADKSCVRVTRRVGDVVVAEYYPPTAHFLPGDVIQVSERWF
jgi:polysaccharide biosynthesis/export protein